MREYFYTGAKKHQYILLVGDCLLVFLSMYFSFVLKALFTQHHVSFDWAVDRVSVWVLPLNLCYLFCIYLFDLYNPNKNEYSTKRFFDIFLSVLLANCFIGLMLYFVPKYVFGRYVFVLNLILSVFFLVSWRMVFVKKLLKKRRSRLIKVVGSKSVVLPFISEMKKVHSNSADNFISCIVDEDEYGGKNITEIDNCDIFLFDSVDSTFSDEEAEKVMELRLSHKYVYDVATYYKNITGKIPLRYIDGNWLLRREAAQGVACKYYLKIKRIFDLLFSLALLFVLAPFLLVIGLAIKLDSKGPALFVQERLGLNKKPFKCIKFRTMVADAEAQTGPVWAQCGDSRVTRIGRLLRKTRMDELPQLYNVVVGEMSFIGPRPIRKHFADSLALSVPFYDLRFRVQPGLSGWAQVSCGYADSGEKQREKFEYELFYIHDTSFFLDCLVFVKTLKALFRVQGK